jgi:hypothetical protein
MATIRPFERDDIPAVTSLYEQVARSGSRIPPPGLDAYFERTFFDYPWADPDIPSLVYVDERGDVAGFIGSSVRRLVFDGDQIRMGIAGQLVTEPRARSHAAGTFLMREYLAGPQDLTITDTASELVRRIWERLGGDTLQLACVGWVRVFRPLRFAGEFAARRQRRTSAWAARVLGRPVDAAARTALRGTLEPPRPAAEPEPLTPQALLELMPTIARGFSIRPAYDAEFLDWLFRELAVVESHGTLVAHVVRGEDGTALGWYVYYRRSGGIGAVLQVTARDGAIGPVVDTMFHDAAANGAAGVQGRLEGILREPLAQRGCLFHPSGYLALVHARDADLLRAIHAGRALLTRLEGEWWTGHHLVHGGWAE